MRQVTRVFTRVAMYGQGIGGRIGSLSDGGVDHPHMPIPLTVMSKASIRSCLEDCRGVAIWKHTVEV